MSSNKKKLPPTLSKLDVSKLIRDAICFVVWAKIYQSGEQSTTEQKHGKAAKDFDEEINLLLNYSHDVEEPKSFFHLITEYMSLRVELNLTADDLNRKSRASQKMNGKTIWTTS